MSDVMLLYSGTADCNGYGTGSLNGLPVRRYALYDFDGSFNNISQVLESPHHLPLFELKGHCFGTCCHKQQQVSRIRRGYRN